VVEEHGQLHRLGRLPAAFGAAARRGGAFTAALGAAGAAVPAAGEAAANIARIRNNAAKRVLRFFMFVILS